MTLSPECRGRSRPHRAFTRADDDIIRAMCAAGMGRVNGNGAAVPPTSLGEAAEVHGSRGVYVAV